MNDNVIENYTSIIQPFIHSVNHFADRRALWVNKQYYSYDKLYQLARPIVNWLHTINAKRVLIFSQRTLAAYQAIIATLLAGKAYVPLNPTMPMNKNNMMSDLADTDVIIADGKLIKQLNEFFSLQSNKTYQLLLLNIDQKSTSHYQHVKVYTQTDCDMTDLQIPSLQSTLDDDACLLFTSGSTGVPKGVMLSHGNILSYLRHMITHYHVNQDDHISQMTELTFDFSVQDMFMSWAVGACVYAFPENYFIGLPNFLNDHQITFMTTVPSTIRLLHNMGKLTKNSLPYLRQNIFGGESLTDSAASLWQHAAPNTTIDNVYGPTETTIAYTAYRWQQPTGSSIRNCIPLGKPFPGQHIKIVNSQFEAVSLGKIGELCLHGSQVINGYWRNVTLSKQKFVKLPNQQGKSVYWYLTGDMVLWDPQNGLIFKGRVDDQIQIRGYRVEKLDIERVIREIAKTEFVAVIPWPITTDGTIQSVIAFVSDTSLSSASIRKQCRAELPDYMIPKAIYLVNHLPLNVNGKIDYLTIKQWASEYYEANVN